MRDFCRFLFFLIGRLCIGLVKFIRFVTRYFYKDKARISKGLRRHIAPDGVTKGLPPSHVLLHRHRLDHACERNTGTHPFEA